MNGREPVKAGIGSRSITVDVGMAERIRHGERAFTVPGDPTPEYIKAATLMAIPFGAPWRWVDLTLPCETVRPIHNRIGPDFGKPDHRSCPDCVGGVPLVEIRETCPHPHGEREPFIPCPDGGSLLVATATVEVLPVVGATSDLLTVCSVVIFGNDAELFDPAPNAERWTRLALDPLPVPGRDWVVLFDNVTLP